MADAWSEVLDDLDARLTAAETGSLETLDGWAPPAGPLPAMTAGEQVRAMRIAERQRMLEAQLRTAMARVAGSAVSLRQRSALHRLADAAPVYVDRSA